MVEDVIEKLRGRDARPMAPEKLAVLRGPDDLPLPEELRVWLAFDASWLPLFDGDDWNTTTPGDFAAGEVAEVAEEIADAGIDDFDADEAVDAIVATLPDPDLEEAPAIRLPDSASQQHLLVFHDGRAYVLGYEKESFWVKYPTFGAFLAAHFG